MGQRVLLVEDSPTDAAVLKHQLGDSVEVRHAKSLQEALDALSDEHDVILLDLELPDSSGLATVRSIVDHSSVPVVVATATDDPQLAGQCLDVGATDLVVKGTLSPAGLKHMLLRAVGRHAPAVAPRTYPPLQPVLRHVMRAGRATLDEISAATGIHRQTVWRTLHKMQGDQIDGFAARVPAEVDGWQRVLIQIRGVPDPALRELVRHMAHTAPDMGLEFIAAHATEGHAVFEVLAHRQSAVKSILAGWLARHPAADTAVSPVAWSEFSQAT